LAPRSQVRVSYANAASYMNALAGATLVSLKPLEIVLAR